MIWLTLWLFGPAFAEPPALPPIPDRAKVIKVYDGDTVTLENGDKVRLRWVNTPEKRPPEPFWEEAQRLAERLVLGRTVRLAVTGEDARDGYGRIVAGLHNGRQDLSLELLRQGYGHLFIIPPEPASLDAMLAAQKQARENRRGIWSTDRYRGTLHITSFHADARGDDTQNVNGEYLRVCNVTTNPVDLDGYVLRQEGGESFTLPRMVLPAGYTVLIHSGRGLHQRDVAEQMHIYLGLPTPLWDNKHSEATLLDPNGEVVDRVVHHVKGR